MYIYIYDSYVNQKKYDKILAHIETRITDLSLNGKIVRVGIMTSVNDVVDTEVKRGINTIIAVGNNYIFNQVLNAIGRLLEYNKNLTLGFIPVGRENNEIADLLGIDLEEGACDALSARRLNTLDLGRVNNSFFLTQAEINTEATKIEVDENFSIETDREGTVYILNLPLLNFITDKQASDPEDGKLELFITNKKNNKIIIPSNEYGRSYFDFNNLNIISKKHKIKLDNSLLIETPASVKIAKEKINLIVGRSRKF
ncbi:MAG: diacylglycerol kinase family protein [Candidatus Falkowbacteria bacterium]|nr:diacylglycerol kinase family protein [Candidatus Falkowbacteria bacterium]